jgi:hypothetical protein
MVPSLALEMCDGQQKLVAPAVAVYSGLTYQDAFDEVGG